MKNRKNWLILSGLCITSQVCANNSANTVANLLDLSLAELLEVQVITASRYEESLLETPSTTIVINRRQIETRAYHNLIDLMQDLPGFDIQRHNDPTRYHDITLRGHFTHRKFMILQDGVRIDAPTNETIAVADNFPLHHAERVEVVYGPTSALYGADAFGGVINIITQDGKQAQGVRLAAQTGSDDYGYYRFNAGHAFNHKWRGHISGHLHEADSALSSDYPALFAPVGAVTFDGRTIVPAAQREAFDQPTQSRTLFARLDYDEHFTLGIQHSLFRHLSAVGDKPANALYLEDAEWNNQVTTAYAKYTHQFSDQLSGTSTFNYALHEQAPESRFNNIFTNFADGYKYAKGERWGFDQQLNAQLTKQHQLISGISYEDYYALPRTPDLPVPYDTSNSPSQQGLFYPNTDGRIGIDILEMDYDNLAAYTQLNSRWGEQWSSVVGLRYDQNSRFSGTLNPRLGIVFQPNSKTAYKLLYGEAFRAPSAHENQRVFGSFSGATNAQGEYLSSFFAAPNSNLEPEKLRNLEFIYLRQWQRTQFSLSSYYTEVEDIIMTRAENPPTQFIPGAFLQSTNIADNLGTETHYGVDITLDYQQDFTAGWQGEFWAAYSYTDGTVNSGNGYDVELPYIAQHKLKLATTFTYNKRYFITPKLYLIDSTNTNRTLTNDPSQRQQSPGFGVMDVHFGANEVLPKLSLRFSIYNLFDRQYYHAGGSTSTNFANMPQDRRSWRLGLEYQF